MKREAEQLGQQVKELVRELVDEGACMPANEFFVTNHKARVASLRLFVRPKGEQIAAPMNVTTQQACELAAWLVVAAGLGEHMSMEEARAYFERAYTEALNS